MSKRQVRLSWFSLCCGIYTKLASDEDDVAILVNMMFDYPKRDAIRQPLLRAHTQAGTCRVICFSPRHDLTLAQMSTAELLNVGHQVTVYDNLSEGHHSAVDARAKFILGRREVDGDIIE